MIVAAIDVGAPRNIGWAIIDDGIATHGIDLDEFIKLFSKACAGQPTALGFEAPLFIPRRQNLEDITRQRNGEAGRPWSAGAGATVTTIGLAVVDYTLSRLRELLPDKPATLDYEKWLSSNELLIWEAFISGGNHAAPGEHWRDALTAAQGFIKAYPNLAAHNAINEHDVVSLAGLSLVRTGWVKPNQNILSQPTLVIRPRQDVSIKSEICPLQ